MADSSSISAKWGWFLLLGLVSMVAGVFALVNPLVVTLVSVIFIGASLMVGGVFQLIQSFMTKEWSGFTLGIIGGLLSIIGGILIMREPVAGSVIITLLLLAVLVVSGVVRIVIALRHRELRMWWFLALGGLVSVVAGILLYATLPWSSLWILGTLIGIELLFEGAGWISFSLDLRKHRAGMFKAIAVA